MKHIAIYCKTLKAAERHLNRLYNQYDHVRLIDAPMFTEHGTYTFEVC